MATLSAEPRRTQDRREASVSSMHADTCWQEFNNESDTDFSLPANVEWAESILATWKDRHSDQATVVPLVVAGEHVTQERTQRECYDPSRQDLVVARYRQANAHDIDRAVACAKADHDGWRSRTVAERRAVLINVAQELRERRGDLMGAALSLIHI